MWIKMLRLSFVLILTSSIAQAQNWDELFRQKKTQKKYLLQQITALQVYSGYLKKGYDLVHSGLGEISWLTGLEYDLHQTFIRSLGSVSPFIRADPRAAEVLLMQHSIIQAFDALVRHPLLWKEDMEYINTVRKKLDRECSTDLQELLLVVSPGEVNMKDDERIKWLNRIHERMQDKLIFTRHFSNQVSNLAGQRHLEQIDTKRLELMFNLKMQP
jgi:hypothetical protein